MPPLPLSLPETRAEPALWAVCSLFALQGSVAVGNPSQQCPAEPGHAALPASLSGDLETLVALLSSCSHQMSVCTSPRGAES